MNMVITYTQNTLSTVGNLYKNEQIKCKMSLKYMPQLFQYALNYYFFHCLVIKSKTYEQLNKKENKLSGVTQTAPKPTIDENGSLFLFANQANGRKLSIDSLPMVQAYTLHFTQCIQNR